MSYEAWRITYQCSEQAARAAFEEIQRLKASAPPPDTQGFLIWCADELVKRDRFVGSFAVGLAESLRGRADLLKKTGVNS